MIGAPTSFIGDTATRVVLAVIALTDEQGIPPTLREVGDRVGISLSVVQHHVRRLTDLGMLGWEPGKSRTLHARVIHSPVR